MLPNPLPFKYGARKYVCTRRTGAGTAVLNLREDEVYARVEVFSACSKSSDRAEGATDGGGGAKGVLAAAAELFLAALVCCFARLPIDRNG